MNIKEDLLTPSEWARPEKPLKAVKGLVIHWVANPMTDPYDNWAYWETRRGSYGSAHYIIGIQGTVLHCLPDDEMAYHCGAKIYTDKAVTKFGTYPNNSTIGIETCHKSWTGEYTPETLSALRELCRDLCLKYDIAPENIVRHYDITEKECPRFFVTYPGIFDWFKQIVAQDLEAVSDCRCTEGPRTGHQ